MKVPGRRMISKPRAIFPLVLASLLLSGCSKPSVHKEFVQPKPAIRVAESSAVRFSKSPDKPAYVSGGKVYYRVSRDRPPRQLTTFGSNSDPVLSPDGRIVAFVHSISGKSIPVGWGPTPETDLWTVETTGSDLHVLLKGRSAENMEHVLAGIRNLEFSPDGDFIYFRSSAWVTSDALHVVDLHTGMEGFLCPANRFEVVQGGKHSGDVLVQQHRLQEKKLGTTDWVYLFSPQGKQIETIGDPSSPAFDRKLKDVGGTINSSW